MTDTLEWTGRVGDAWAEEWPRTDRSLADLARQLNAAILSAAPETGVALDIGCGAGGTSLALAASRPNLAITGVDISPALVAVAEQRAAGIANLQFRVADAQTLGALGADLIVSRHGVMFFPDPVAGFAALRRAAKPGARLVFSCFRPRAFNEWTLVTEAALGGAPASPPGYTPGPYSLADHDFTRDMLERAGWTSATAQIADFRYVAGAGDDPVADALSYFLRIGPAARLIAAADPADQCELRVNLAAALADHLRDGAVTFAASAWIWTAIAGEAAS